MDGFFDRSVINVRERPVSSDINVALSEVDRTIRDLFSIQARGRASFSDDTVLAPVTGFLGESLKVKALASPAMSIRIRPGLGFLYSPTDVPLAINGVPGLDDPSVYKPLPLANEQQIVVPNNSSGNPRIDIVEVIDNRSLTDSSSRDVLNSTTGQFAALVVQKTLTWLMDTSLPTPGSGNSTTAIGYKTGTPSASPVPPAGTPGYTKIAEILVANGAVSITQGVIKDLRTLLFRDDIARLATEVTANASVSIAAAMNRLITSAGTQLVVVETSFTNAVCDVYVFIGNAPAALPTIDLRAQQNGVGIPCAVTTAVSLVSIASGDVTEITGSGSTTPGYTPAVGQPAWKFTIACSPSGGTAVTYTIGVNGNGF